MSPPWRATRPSNMSITPLSSNKKAPSCTRAKPNATPDTTSARKPKVVRVFGWIRAAMRPFAMGPRPLSMDSRSHETVCNGPKASVDGLPKPRGDEFHGLLLIRRLTITDSWAAPPPPPRARPPPPPPPRAGGGGGGGAPPPPPAVPKQQHSHSHLPHGLGRSATSRGLPAAHSRRPSPTGRVVVSALALIAACTSGEADSRRIRRKPCASDSGGSLSTSATGARTAASGTVNSPRQ